MNYRRSYFQDSVGFDSFRFSNFPLPVHTPDLPTEPLLRNFLLDIFYTKLL
jgi:hypothetical protein